MATSPSLSLFLALLFTAQAPADPVPPAQRTPGQKLVTVIPGELPMDLVWIPAGRFVMGSPPSDKDRNYGYAPKSTFPGRPTHDVEKQHTVRFRQGWWIGAKEVTQAQWEAAMGNNPSQEKGDENLPVERVSYEDVQEFLAVLNDHADAGHYRLPTESEWEYAARAGCQDRYLGDLDEYAWHRGTSSRKPHPVGQKKPNAWGLYDVHGNLTEWCSDWFGPYPDGEVVDPMGVSREESLVESNGVLIGKRVTRGGAFTGRSLHCRLSDRATCSPDKGTFYLGFRVVWVESPPKSTTSEPPARRQQMRMAPQGESG